MNSPYKNQPLFGAGFSAINASMLAGSAVACKFLAEFFGPVEIIFFRNLVALSMLVIGYITLRRKLVLKTNRPWHQALRAAIGTISVIIGVWAISLLPLAEMTVLFFTSPLFVVILSPILLKEKIGLFRMTTAVIGFSGILVMATPSNDIPILGLCVGLAYGFGAALVDICLRWLGNTENASTTTFYFMSLGLFVTSLYLPFSNTIQNFEWSWWIIILLLGLGFTNVLALLAKSESFRRAQASIIASITYTMIIWTIMFDYMIWDRIPSLTTLTGAIIIITSNLFILYREQKAAQLDAKIT